MKIRGKSLMEPRRFSGKTVEEATDNALEALDANLEDVEVVVVNPGRSGILGFGGEPAEITVTQLEAGATGRTYEDEPESGEDDYAQDSDDDYEDDFATPEPSPKKEQEKPVVPPPAPTHRHIGR